MRGLFQVLVTSAIVVSPGTAFGQGGTTATISGTVVDSGGGVVPGADIVDRHNATGILTSAVSSGQGAFVVPGLTVGR